MHTRARLRKTRIVVEKRVFVRMLDVVCAAREA
jgi:hypothetical protein